MWRSVGWLVIRATWMPRRTPLIRLFMGVRILYFFFSSRRRHTRLQGDWSSDVCSSDLEIIGANDWSFERASNEEMLAEVAGRWCSYRLFFFWQEEISAMQFSCQFDLKEIGRASCRERV